MNPRVPGGARALFFLISPSSSPPPVSWTPNCSQASLHREGTAISSPPHNLLQPCACSCLLNCRIIPLRCSDRAPGLVYCSIAQNCWAQHQRGLLQHLAWWMSWHPPASGESWDLCSEPPDNSLTWTVGLLTVSSKSCRYERRDPNLAHCALEQLSEGWKLFTEKFCSCPIHPLFSYLLHFAHLIAFLWLVRKPG